MNINNNDGLCGDEETMTLLSSTIVSILGINNRFLLYDFDKRMMVETPPPIKELEALKGGMQFGNHILVAFIVMTSVKIEKYISF